MVEASFAIREAFQIRGQGTLLIPDWPEPRWINVGILKDEVVIVRPDHTVQPYTAQFRIEHFSRGYRHGFFAVVVVLKDVYAADISRDAQLSLSARALEWTNRAIGVPIVSF